MSVYIQLLYYLIAVTSQNLNEGYEQIALSMLTKHQITAAHTCCQPLLKCSSASPIFNRIEFIGEASHIA